MKIVSTHPKGFRPFTLTVTAETLDELYNLYARLNMSTNAVIAESKRQGWRLAIQEAVQADRNALLFELLKYMPEEDR